jgi:L-alanine-DL-glutamate epimerase-like enolase superfamily enzyme
MKIEKLTCYAVEVPAMDGTYAMSHGRVLRSFPSTVVKVTAADGTPGFGEACTLGGNYLDGFPGSARETIRELAPWVLECDPLEPDVLVDGMDSLVIGHLPGKAAIDIAMWDLRGRLLDLPVARLLGGVKQHSFGAFQAISLGSPAEMADEVTRMTDLGFRRWQLKLGDDPLLDAQRVHAVADVLPADSALLTSDANRGWTVAETLRFVTAVAGVDTYLEQPCQTTAELARVRRHCPLPLMIDEGAREAADILGALALDCIDAINLKPTRVGGITKAARIRDLAQACGLMIMLDEPQGADLATAGLAQLAATMNPQTFLGTGCFMGAHMPFSYQRAGQAKYGPCFDGGMVRWNDAPGLGVDVDESVLGPPIFQLSRSAREDRGMPCP